MVDFTKYEENVFVTTHAMVHINSLTLQEGT